MVQMLHDMKSIFMRDSLYSIQNIQTSIIEIWIYQQICMMDISFSSLYEKLSHTLAAKYNCSNGHDCLSHYPSCSRNKRDTLFRYSLSLTFSLSLICNQYFSLYETEQAYHMYQQTKTQYIIPSDTSEKIMRIIFQIF